MTMELLERKEIDVCDSLVEEGRQELAVKAQRLLGYYHLNHEMERYPSSSKGKILAACQKLGIKPFTNESVQKYKRNVVMGYRWRNVPALICEWGPSAVGVSAILAGLFSLISMFVIGVVWASFSLWTLWTFLGGIGGVVVAACFAGLVDNAGMSSFQVEWKQCRINEYGKAIPEFALQTAVDVAEICGRVTFYVEELQIHRRPIGDPFLVVEDSSGEQYYLEVWNEPDFKQKRMN